MDVEQLSKITVNTDLIADISKECNDLLELQKQIEKMTTTAPPASQVISA